MKTDFCIICDKEEDKVNFESIHYDCMMKQHVDYTHYREMIEIIESILSTPCYHAIKSICICYKAKKLLEKIGDKKKCQK